MDQLPERNCKFCGDPFIPRTSKQLYDVLDCRYRQARQVAYEKRQAEKADRVAREVARRNAAMSVASDIRQSVTN